jgi:cytochrome c biogenesis protein CcmG, thiol:disulfide interchange protein DsbE
MSKRNVVLVGLVVLIFVSLTYWILRLRAGTPQEVAVGESAPNFELPALGHGTAGLGEYRHQVVVLNFWATWCPPCVEEAPSLEKFAEQMRSEGVAVIGVSVDQDQAELEKFVAEYGLTFPIARDPNQDLAGRYGTSKFPETYILDRDGRVAEKIVGPIDWHDPRIIDFVRELAHPGVRASR